MREEHKPENPAAEQAFGFREWFLFSDNPEKLLIRIGALVSE
jgi:hypothetical protein